VTRKIELSASVLRAGRAVVALDEIYELHAKALDFTSGEALVHSAFADLSDAICAILGQIAATSAAAARKMLTGMIPVVKRRGADSLEPILLSAFMSAMRDGVTAETGAAAALWLKPDVFPDRLAGGAVRVPLLNAERLTIGSVSVPELALAVAHSGGSASQLNDRLRRLVDGSGEGDEDFDDPTLEPIAVACADAYAATVTAEVIRRAGQLSPDLFEKLADIVGVDPKKWQGPSKQLQSGDALALAVWTNGAGTTEESAHVGSTPPALAPRGRRSLSTAVNSKSGGVGTRLVPAQVTTERPTWVRVEGRTAVLHPPRGLVPPPPEALGGGRPGDQVVGTDSHVVPTFEKTVPVGSHPIVHPLGGHLVHPVTGLPIPQQPGPELAEVAIVEAGQLGVDVRTTTVGEFIDMLVNSR
jgi:hypothetical protein